MKHKHLFTFGSVLVVAWVLGTFLFLYFWPHIAYNVYKKGIVDKGFGSGPIPVNTLYTEPQTLFADPLAAQPASGASASRANLMTTGVNRDTLLTVGWLDLSKGPQVLHVPDMSNPYSSGTDSSSTEESGRYYSVQFTDPSDGTDFAYVGKRTTGTQAGDYLITNPGWKGQVPGGITRIASPNNSVLVLGRILVYSDSDLQTAYDLAKQIQLTPLSQWKPGL